MLGKLSSAGATNARLQSRPKLLKYSDISTVIHTTAAPAFFYLQPIVPTTVSLASALERKHQLEQEISGGVVDPPQEEIDYSIERKGHTPIVIGKPMRTARPKRASIAKKGKKATAAAEKRDEEGGSDKASGDESNDEEYRMDMD